MDCSCIYLHGGVELQVMQQSVRKAQLCRDRAVLDLNPGKGNAAKANCLFTNTSSGKRKVGTGVGRGSRKGKRGKQGANKGEGVLVGSKETKYSDKTSSKMTVVRDALEEKGKQSLDRL